jgi:hypothetical protein
MKRLETVLTSILLMAGTTAFGQVSETVNLTTAGTLKEYAFVHSKDSITDLIVTGNIDARDIQFMRDSMRVLAHLDLEGSNIVAFTGRIAFGNQDYPANEMPVSSFLNEGIIGNTSLHSIVFPAGLTSIGDRAFEFCSGLTSLTFPSGLTSIAEMAFAHCGGLTGIVHLPAGLTFLGDAVFGACGNLSGFTIDPNNTHYTTENGVLFNRDKSELIQYPAGKQDVHYKIPASVTSIHVGVFMACRGLTSVTFPSGLTSIAEAAFWHCIGLTSLTFPSGLIFIGDRAFWDCSGLKEIINQNPMPITINANVFEGVNQSVCTLKVPSSSVSAYKAAAVWKEFITQ